MGDIVYSYAGSAYLNITNRCCCACTFCIRSQTDHLGSASSLWLGGDPTQDEILAAIDAFDWTGYKEAVFCGYGEPTCALEKLVETASYLREKYGLRIRLNTNGLSDLVNGKPTARLLGEVVDAVSISLNAPTPEAYLAVTRPSFGEDSFEAMLAFARDCKTHVKEVRMSIVDTISPEDIAASQALADSLGIYLRIRHFNEDIET